MLCLWRQGVVENVTLCDTIFNLEEVIVNMWHYIKVRLRVEGSGDKLFAREGRKNLREASESLYRCLKGGENSDFSQ